MFYTKYRPQKFSEISRPNEAADALAAQVLSKKTVHAYLFVGPRGTGKTSTARILAKALNCSHLSKKGDPCDECSSCEAIRKGSYLDLIEIDAASNRGIDDIRELKNRVKLAPTTGQNKIYIIDEVHMLTTEAFNALLKTLEEPPKNTVFILCTTEFHKVPETIKSRCQVFKFRRATIRQITTKLERIVEEEALNIEKADLEKIARASLGGFRDAETMLQQIAEGEVTVDALLNVGSREKYVEFCGHLMTKDTQSAMKIVDKIFNEGADLYVWSGEFVKHLRDLLMLKSGMSAEVIEIPDELLSEVKEQAAGVPLGWLVNCLEIFTDAQSKIKTSFIPQLPVEIAVVKVCGDLDEQQPIAVPRTTPINPVTLTKTTKITETVEVIPSNEIEGPPADDSETFSVELSFIEQKWADVISKVERINRSILGLLKVGKPIAMEGKFLILEVSYLFHKERLEAPRNREVVENVLAEIYGNPIKVKCVLGAEKPKPLRPKEVGVLTDFNVVAIDKNAAIDMLDGGLPL